MSAPQQGLTVTEMTDGIGRPLSRKVKLSPTIEYTSSYAYNGRDVTMTDARGVVTAMKMSAFGQVGDEEMYHPSQPNTKLTTSQRYSAFGAMKSYTDENGRTSQYIMDGLNRVTQALYPANNISERFSYDGEGNLLSHIDGRGITRQMSYDNLGRVKDNFTVGAGGNIPGVTVAHIEQTGVDNVTDPDGNQLSLPFASKDIETDPLGHQTVKRYDGLRRILSITNADSRTKRYEYDGVNLTRESDWKGQFTSYRYDRINRLTEIIDRVGQLTSISYNDANGLTRTITDRRTNQRIESYDALGRLANVRVGGQPLASYEYDANSNRTAMLDGRNNRTDYSYDAFNRVTSVNHANIQTETFGYDSSGNLTNYFDGRGGSVGQVFDELNRLTSRTDGAGNTTQFKYDGRGLLTELIEPKRDAQNNPTSRTLYEYNELGSLTKVTDANNGVWQCQRSFRSGSLALSMIQV